MCLEVGRHLRVAHVLEPDAILELLLEETPDQHLLSRPLHLWEVVEAPPVGLLREQLEAHHLVEKLPTPLG